MSAGKSSWSSMRSKRTSEPSARCCAPRPPKECERRLYGIYLAHYAVRLLLAQAAVEAELDPDRLSFTAGLFELTEMISLALTLEPEEATAPLLARLRHKMAQHVLPARRLHIPRIAQRGCGRANPDVMSESHAEPDVELVRENRNRGMESKKGRGWEELRNSQT